MNATPHADHLLTPGDVAEIYRVTSKTVSHWADAGRLPSVRTPGGHHRFREADVQALLDGERIRAAAIAILSA